MSKERRRYFRIDDTVGLSYQALDVDDEHEADSPAGLDVLGLMADQDEKIQSLLKEVALESPSTAALVRALNQKLERIVSLLVADSQLVDRLAYRFKQVSISACGMAFVHEVDVPVGTHLSLELELAPKKCVIRTKGVVVAVDPVDDGFYWRINFYDIPQVQQEQLIQHIVQRQSALLKTARDSED